MNEYVDYLYLEYLRVYGGVKKDDPVEIAKEILMGKLGEEEKELFGKFIEMVNKQNKEKMKHSLTFGFYNAKEIFK